MNAQTSPAALPLGLLELDPEGTVIRYSPVAERSAPRQDVLGRNLFTEVLPAEELYGFRARFHAFMARAQKVEKFSLSVSCPGGVINIQVVLAAVKERGVGGRDRLALIRITLESPTVMAHRRRLVGPSSAM
jgi:hypothetical protein